MSHFWLGIAIMFSCWGGLILFRRYTREMQERVSRIEKLYLADQAALAAYRKTMSEDGWTTVCFQEEDGFLYVFRSPDGRLCREVRVSQSPP